MKKDSQGVKDYKDYTVYPLEGVYDINEKAKKNFNGIVNKDDLVYTLMIRQPEFVTEVFFNQIAGLVDGKKLKLPIDKVRLDSLQEGPCIQMLHIGSFDDEPASFRIMEEFAQEHQKMRLSKMHREIYLNDFRKVPAEKLRTVLRFQIKG